MGRGRLEASNREGRKGLDNDMKGLVKKGAENGGKMGGKDEGGRKRKSRGRN